MLWEFLHTEQRKISCFYAWILQQMPRGPFPRWSHLTGSKLPGTERDGDTQWLMEINVSVDIPIIMDQKKEGGGHSRQGTIRETAAGEKLRPNATPAAFEVMIHLKLHIYQFLIPACLVEHQNCLQGWYVQSQLLGKCCAGVAENGTNPIRRIKGSNDPTHDLLTLFVLRSPWANSPSSSSFFHCVPSCMESKH